MPAETIIKVRPVSGVQKAELSACINWRVCIRVFLNRLHKLLDPRPHSPGVQYCSPSQMGLRKPIVLANNAAVPQGFESFESAEIDAFFLITDKARGSVSFFTLRLKHACKWRRTERAAQTGKFQSGSSNKAGHSAVETTINGLRDRGISTAIYLEQTTESQDRSGASCAT